MIVIRCLLAESLSYRFSSCGTEGGAPIPHLPNVEWKGDKCIEPFSNRGGYKAVSRDVAFL